MDDNNIDKKRKENKKDGKIDNKSDWGGFVSGCLISTLLFALITLISVNFVYFTSLNDNVMNKFFPSELDKYSVDGNNDSNYDSSWEEIKHKVKNIGVPPNFGWPYTKKRNDKSFTFENWLAVSTSSIYTNLRATVKALLKVFGENPEIPRNEQILTLDIVKIIFINVLFIVGLLLFPILGIPLYLVGIILMTFLICNSTFNSLFDISNLLHYIYATFVPTMAFMLSVGLSYLIPAQFYLTLLVLPLFADYKSITKILKRNCILFVSLFLIFITGNAIKYKLNLSIVSALVVGVIYSLYKNVKSYTRQ